MQIDLEPNGQCPFAVLNQSENGKYNLISVWFDEISEIFLCVSLELYKKVHRKKKKNTQNDKEHEDKPTKKRVTSNSR